MYLDYSLKFPTGRAEYRLREKLNRNTISPSREALVHRLSLRQKGYVARDDLSDARKSPEFVPDASPATRLSKNLRRVK